MKRSRFPRQFVIFKSTPVFLDIVLTQTFIPDTLDSVPQAITWDITPDTTLDTTPDTALALAISADRFVILVNFLNKLDLYYMPIYNLPFITSKGHSFFTYLDRENKG